MAVVSGGGRLKLNPWAEPFVPSGVRYYQAAAQDAEVDDFSPDWWRLVAASPAFRDRWLSDYAALGLLDEDGHDSHEADAVDSFLPDDLSFSPPPPRHAEGDSKKDEDAACKKGEVAAWGIDRWWRAHGAPPEPSRYAEKAPRRVARASPRPIQQPR